MAHRFLPPVRCSFAADSDWVSRFSHPEFLCVRGVFDSAGPRCARAIAHRVFAFRHRGHRLLPDSQISELNTPPTYTPVQRFKCSLTACPRMARGQVGSLVLFLYDSFIHYSRPVYPDAIPHSLFATLIAPTTTVSRRAVGDFYIRAERASLPPHAPNMLAV